MALSGQYIDLSEVVERVFQDYPFTEDIKISDASLWAFRCLNSLGIADFYVSKVTNGEEGNPDPIAISNYRGELPLDIHAIYLARDYDTQIPMYCTSSPFKSNVTLPANQYASSLTYSTNNSFIITSFETGNVEIQYWAFPTSPLGIPMVPSEERVVNAVVTFIAEKIAKILYMEDRLSEAKYERILQDSLFYMASASTKGRMPSVDQMETLKNQWIRLIQDPNLHDSSFRYIADKNRLILHTPNSIWPRSGEALPQNTGSTEPDIQVPTSTANPTFYEFWSGALVAGVMKTVKHDKNLDTGYIINTRVTDNNVVMALLKASPSNPRNCVDIMSYDDIVDPGVLIQIYGI
jgi:hypothetical protein